MRAMTTFLVSLIIFGLGMRWFRPNWSLRLLLVLSLCFAVVTTVLQLVRLGV